MLKGWRWFKNTTVTKNEMKLWPQLEVHFKSVVFICKLFLQIVSSTLIINLNLSAIVSSTLIISVQKHFIELSSSPTVLFGVHGYRIQSYFVKACAHVFIFKREITLWELLGKFGSWNCLWIFIRADHRIYRTKVFFFFQVWQRFFPYRELLHWL